MLRKFGPLQSHLIFFLALTFSTPLVAQAADRDKKEEKEKTAPRMVNISGTVRCGKPNPSYSIDVPDRAGHSLILAQRNCSWTEPLEILGAKAKTGVWVTFTARMEVTLHPHSFEVDTLDNGEKITKQTMGQVYGEKGPIESKGRFSFMRGTGKFKGIRGGGTYQANLDADDVLTFTLEGVYDPAAMGGGTK
jgi:hypothetical protein